jgi:hypothetical protein
MSKNRRPGVGPGIPRAIVGLVFLHGRQQQLQTFLRRRVGVRIGIQRQGKHDRLHVECLGNSLGPRKARLAVARLGDPLGHFGQHRLIDRIAAELRLAQGPAHEGPVMAGDATVVGLPLQCILGEKRQSAVDCRPDIASRLVAKCNWLGDQYQQHSNEGSHGFFLPVGLQDNTPRGGKRLPAATLVRGGRFGKNGRLTPVSEPDRERKSMAKKRPAKQAAKKPSQRAAGKPTKKTSGKTAPAKPKPIKTAAAKKPAKPSQGGPAPKPAKPPAKPAKQAPAKGQAKDKPKKEPSDRILFGKVNVGMPVMELMTATANVLAEPDFKTVRGDAVQYYCEKFLMTALPEMIDDTLSDDQLANLDANQTRDTSFVFLGDMLRKLHDRLVPETFPQRDLWPERFLIRLSEVSGVPVDVYAASVLQTKSYEADTSPQLEAAAAKLGLKPKHMAMLHTLVVELVDDDVLQGA